MLSRIVNTLPKLYGKKEKLLICRAFQRLKDITGILQLDFFSRIPYSIPCQRFYSDYFGDAIAVGRYQAS
jgi:hypothetical protein